MGDASVEVGACVSSSPAPSASAASLTASLSERRRNSTYLALACANAVSQGAMTRKVRQIFENHIQQSQPQTPVSLLFRVVEFRVPHRLFGAPFDFSSRTRSTQVGRLGFG